MAILIKGMEMPKSCPCELVGIGYDMYCAFVHGIPARVKEYDECCEKGTRPDWCPAIEVPEPHGRLIDADAFVKKCEEMADKEDGNQLDALILLRWFLEQNAPTIIPASEEVST